VASSVVFVINDRRRVRIRRKNNSSPSHVRDRNSRYTPFLRSRKIVHFSFVFRNSDGTSKRLLRSQLPTYCNACEETTGNDISKSLLRTTVRNVEPLLLCVEKRKRSGSETRLCRESFRFFERVCCGHVSSLCG